MARYGTGYKYGSGVKYGVTPVVQPEVPQVIPQSDAQWAAEQCVIARQRLDALRGREIDTGVLSGLRGRTINTDILSSLRRRNI